MVLAVLFLVEAWIWQRMEPVVRWFTTRLPFDRLKAAVSHWARDLPAYGALVLFLSPLLLIEPLQCIAIWAYAHHHWLMGSVILVLIKLFGVGLMAFLFAVCERQLMSIGWFAQLVELFLKVKQWAELEVEPLRAAIAACRKRAAARIRTSRRGIWRRVTLLRRRILARARA